MERLLSTLRQATPFGWGVAAGLALLLALRIFVAPEDRKYLRHPIVLLVLHGILVVVRAALPEGGWADRPLQLTALFLLLASVGLSAFLLLHWVIRRRSLRHLPRILQDVFQAFVYAGAAILTLRAAGVEPGSLLTTSALLTAVIGLSLQDTMGNLFAGLAIQAQRPFEVGDWIQFDSNADHIGEVVEINWRATRVLTIERIEVTVPNGTLAKAPIRNFSKPQAVLRRSVIVIAPYGVAPGRVQALLLDAARDVPGVLERPEPTVITLNFSDRGVEYELRFFVTEFGRRDVIAGAVRDRAWYALNREGIPFPPPQRAVMLTRAHAEASDRASEKRTRERELALRNVDFVKPLPDEAIRELAERSRFRLFGAGESVIRQGDPGDEFYIVVSGDVEVLIQGEGRRTHRVARLGAGQFFGEMSAMTGEPRSATVRAVSETRLLCLAKDAFAAVLENAPELADTISEVLAARTEEIEETEPVGERDRRSMAEHSGELLTRIKRFFSI